MSTEVRAAQGDTVDLLAWRHYGRTAGAVEAVLEANPGLADLGPVLPMGTRVIMPDLAPARPEDGRVQLWE
ncbi:tail protein X [Halorhodospira neutriphila]|uniref:Phage tail protein n=1 Tax=Halorhodospira neutriphila TaxID=168379 RepID=A0ABS1E4L8_9GAMM|nr:tail protein X [Halorhodospira neutriphila]MBK1725710.1 phage tail protein [Halorhodospira neutriphila]